ncbi:DUF7670 domain-containing protein [Aestuariivivens insulae]|uniref:DUF7670 domain-containing protein n=1 Tax=Aestuariivivens insulae TaxID=1621988 RepID=UPI001F56D30A|nr:hypothetical protein [Aestuariivivens insulae]
MKANKAAVIIRWIARIYGSIVLLILLIALFRILAGGHNFLSDWKSIVLYSCLIIGLSIAYKWELIGGAIATLGLLISGFIHPLLLPPGILYITYWFLSKRREIKPFK